MSTPPVAVTKRPSRVEITANLSPAWFAAVMGTAVVPLAISFVGSWVRPVAGVFIVLATVMFLATLPPWLERLARHRSRAVADLDHPIAANFYPTMPISMLILALDLMKYPDLLMSETWSMNVAWVLWVLGSAGVYLMGFTVLPRVFGGQGIDLGHANFGWYIPPVSHLLIPVAGLELAAVEPGRFEPAMVVSLVSLGVGLFLFLFVGATVYQRYVVSPPPPAGIAATSFIGVAPPAILAVILFKLSELASDSTVPWLGATALVPMATVGIVVTWGFSLWAFVVAMLVVGGQARKAPLPFALSWWAFTFPTGALAVASGVAWRATGFGSIRSIYLGVVLLLLFVWAVVAVRTARAMVSGRIFFPAH